MKEGKAAWHATGVGHTEDNPILKKVSPFFKDT
jgi:hypothetical protein